MDFDNLAFFTDLMKKDIIENIAQKTGIDNLVELVAERLSGSDLNSLLMAVFSETTCNITPALLLNRYRGNRFVQPAATNMVNLLKMEVQVLELLQKHSFEPIELPPVAQLGTCSVLGPVDQKKIISAIRNTEVLADATNSIALHIAAMKKTGAYQEQHFCTVHRHVRAQPLREKWHTPHFKAGCMVSAGRDTGSYRFECSSLLKHFRALNDLMQQIYGATNIKFKLLSRSGYKNPDLLSAAIISFFNNNAGEINVFTAEAPEANNYYKGIQFKMIIELNGLQIEIADGGFVDWTQQLLENKKERLLISGFGLELLFKFQNEPA